MLRCPHCKNPLLLKGRTYGCCQSHSFDLAREGYVNLIPSGPGIPSASGDAPEMLRARRSFLQNGHFKFLAQALVDRIHSALTPTRSLEARTLLDIGCGEGSYLGFISQELAGAAEIQRLEYYGMDVSKQAVRMAAKAHKHCQFFVGNVHYEIPVLDSSCDFITGVCAPRNFSEFARILKPAGLLLIAIPKPTHLRELRSEVELLQIDQDKEQELLERAAQFALVDRQELEHGAMLTGEEIQMLLTMTPNYWHQEKRSTDALTARMVSFSFTLLCLRAR
jgi:23S rRNA (guanine745-N1)-methyltransferase